MGSFEVGGDFWSTVVSKVGGSKVWLDRVVAMDFLRLKLPDFLASTLGLSTAGGARNLGVREPTTN